MNVEDIMKLERLKAIVKSLAELEIALSTFYGELDSYEELRSLYDKLKKYKEYNLD